MDPSWVSVLILVGKIWRPNNQPPIHQRNPTKTAKRSETVHTHTQYACFFCTYPLGNSEGIFHETSTEKTKKTRTL